MLWRQWCSKFWSPYKRLPGVRVAARFSVRNYGLVEAEAWQRIGRSARLERKATGNPGALKNKVLTGTWSVFVQVPGQVFATFSQGKPCQPKVACL